MPTTNDTYSHVRDQFPASTTRYDQSSTALDWNEASCATDIGHFSQAALLDI